MAMTWLRLLASGCLLAALPLLVLLVVRGPVDGSGDTATGHWGKKTATVNWCERDYVYTPWIAELGNSLSSLTIVVNGVYGVTMHWGTVEARYLFAYAMFVIVGTGSFLFHATLRKEFQMLDELPMMWSNAFFIYCVAQMETKPGPANDRTRALSGCLIAAVTAVLTVLVVLFDEKDQTIFLLAYGGGVAYLIVRSRALDAVYNSKRTVALLEVCIVFYVGGFFLWLVDRNFCPTVRSMHLHALWHLGAGTGTFTAVLLWIWLRNEFLGKKQRLLGATPPTKWIEAVEVRVDRD